MKKILFLFVLLVPAFACAQKVEMAVGDHLAEVPALQTQSELKPGWKIVDYQMKSKLTHYLSGGRASQLAEGWQPKFRVTPGRDEVLVDYVLIRLTQYKTYRKFPKAQLMENDYQRLEPNDFDIKAEEDAFVCRPKAPLRKGEYVLVCLTQKPIGDLQDLMVFPFSVAGIE